MSDVNHPAAREEIRHLIETQAIIKTEQDITEVEFNKATEDLADARRYDPDALPVREMLYARAEQLRRNLKLAMLKPYFTRVDFSELRGDKCVYYIGKYGVLRSGSLQIQVVDWRSPIANLYYSGQIGPVKYTAPDGEIEGELTLKRQFGIEDGKLVTIFDTDVVSRDAYLQSVLGAMSGDRLREIVTTIQSEQNFVIRYPLNQTLIVQGVAGSGKTTIALHRIAYLLYAFQDKIKPENMLILAPNPLFLSFIAGVLPDLGVERVLQTTFRAFIAGYLGDSLPKVERERPSEAILNLPPAERDHISMIARLKGSLETGELLDKWLNEYENNLPPRRDITFGPVTLYTKEQLRRYLLVDEKPFPLSRRIHEFKKQLKRKTKEAAAIVTEWFVNEAERRIERIRVSMPECDAKRDRLVKIYKSRDERIEQVKASVKPFIEDTMDIFPRLAPMDLYREFLNELSHVTNEDTPLGAMADYTLDHMQAGKIEPEDIALVSIIAMRIYELPRLDIRHIVIDEAQDFSPLECRLLNIISNRASMTIVGDLMQGVRAWRGLNDWFEISDGLFRGAVKIHHLITSYRNTIEIMDLALRVSYKHPTPGQHEARPVLRHGPEPVIMPYTSPQAQCDMICRQVNEWHAEGITAIAVIARTAKRLRDLEKKLPVELCAQMLDVESSEYKGGLLLAQAADVKGFEFDGVILADANDTAYPDRMLDARLLYVCLTRPLHRLAVFYSGTITPLLT